MFPFLNSVSDINAKVVAAVDINPQANLVYKHNFKNTKLLQKTIEVSHLIF
jgi:site-specific DNA-cytosine methylase